MNKHAPSLLAALRDLEKAIANAEAIQSGSLDLLRRAAQTIVIEIFEDQPKIGSRAQQPRSRKLKKIA